MAEVRSVSLPRLALAVCALGMLGGTALFWVKASRDADRFEFLMHQRTLETVDPLQRVSVDITAPPPAALVGIPPYPNAVPRRVAERVRGQGEQLPMAWFSTQDSTDDVISFYERAFGNQGRLYVSHRYNARSGYAGWMQPDQQSAWKDAGLEMLDGVMHLVSARRESHETVVLLSAARPMKLVDAAPGRLPPGVVMPPWASESQVFELGEGPLSQTTIFSEVRGHATDEIVGWFRTSLEQHGWRLAEHASAPARSSLDFRRAREQLSLVITPTGEKVGLMVQYANQPLSVSEGLQ